MRLQFLGLGTVKRWGRCVRSALSMVLVLGAAAVGPGSVGSGALAASQSTQLVTLDNVQLTVTAPFLATTVLHAADPGNTHQVAAAYSHNGRESLSIIAVPFGARPAGEKLPIAQSGSVPTYATEAHKTWSQLGARASAGASALLFGRPTQGSEYAWTSMSLGGPNGAGALLEWITEEGSRIWIVRVEGEDSASVERSASGLSLTAANTNVSTTLAQPAGAPAPSAPARAQNLPVKASVAVQTTTPAGVDYSAPSWWNGLCDASDYRAASGITPWQLGSSTYHGLQACAPRPWYNEGPDVMVTFPGAHWGVAEFECVELVMRYMQLAWGVHPYPANGIDVVNGYWTTRSQYNPQGPNLVVQRNGQATELSAGDVLSESDSSAVGHTALVLSTNLDSQGSGTISVLEENASSTGTESYSVNHFVVADKWSHVTGWLHNPADTPNPPPFRGIAVRSDNASGYTVQGDGSIHPFGGAPAPNPGPSIWQGQDIVRGIALRPDGVSGYTVDQIGGLHPFGGAPPMYYGHGFVVQGDLVRGTALTPDGNGGYTVDALGGVHEFGNAPFAQPNYPAFPDDTARGIAVRSDGHSGYVLDKFGGIHPFGPAPDVYQTATFYKPGWDIARGIVLDFDDVSGYVLDGYGGVWPFGVAPAIGYNPTSQGNDKATGVALNHNGAGGFVVDHDGVVTPFAKVSDFRSMAAIPGGSSDYALSSWAGIVSQGGAPPVYYSPDWSPGMDDIARSIALNADGATGYVLDRQAGIHPFGGIPPVFYNPGWSPGPDVVIRNIVVRSDGGSGYVLDGLGGLHPFGNALPVFYFPGWAPSQVDIARMVVLSDDNSGYVLDNQGGIHPFGGAPAVYYPPNVWPDNAGDIARSIVLRSDRVSGYVLDDNGGIHQFGAAPAMHGTGYWPYWDAARSMILNSDLSGFVLDANGIRHPFSQ